MSAPALKPDAPPGWYGKLPSRGDFVTRRLPALFVRRWDDWLQQGLGEARDSFGAAWLDRYLVAPVWRFWLAPGVVRPGAWVGLLMPSVDAVGRHFPITFAVPRAAPAASLGATLAARAWFRELDAVARQVLDVEFSVADLEHALAAMAPVSASEDTLSGELARRLLDPYAGSDGSARPCSVWWCGDAGAASQFLGFDDLPPPASCALLLAPPRVDEPTVTDQWP